MTSDLVIVAGRRRRPPAMMEFHWLAASSAPIVWSPEVADGRGRQMGTAPWFLPTTGHHQRRRLHSPRTFSVRNPASAATTLVRTPA